MPADEQQYSNGGMDHNVAPRVQLHEAHKWTAAQLFGHPGRP